MRGFFIQNDSVSRGRTTLDRLAERILTPKPLYLWGDYQDWTEGSKRTHKRFSKDGWPSGRRRAPGKCVYVKSVSWVRIPPHPPDFRRELVPCLKMAGISLRISKEFAKATEPRRPGKGPKSVSEALLSLFDRTSPKLVRLKKALNFQWLMIFAALPSS